MRFLTLLAILALSYAQVNQLNSLDDLPYDENDRLASQILLFSGDQTCADEVSSLDLELREVYEITGDISKVYFGEGEQTCSLVCLEKGVQHGHIAYALPPQIGQNVENVPQWVQSQCSAIEVGFLSYLKGEATVYWISPSNERVNVGTIIPGERNTMWMETYIGHAFEIVEKSTGITHLTLKAETNAIISIGQYKSHVREMDVSKQVLRTFESEWERAHGVVRTFTPFGFDKGRLPTDLFASMSAYYYNNEKYATIEEWDTKGVFVNWWERDVFFIGMPFKLKKYWQSRLKQLVEAWVGVPLELTDIYGMRRYEDGARLLTHVDREPTHATSLIVNIAQKAIRKPWNIEVYDFADRLHEVEMNPGDIVYYESARCLHGRMQPLEGAYYVNLFAHYRPIGDSLWSKKPNPPGTPAHAIDIGHCSSNGTKATCDGSIPAPYLSPKLQTLKSSRDLYTFWEQTALAKASEAPARNEEL